jgi:hypothetical protein
MNSENIKSIIILKGLPSNFIDEAIFVVKNKKEAKNLNYQDLLSNKNKVIQGYMNEEDLKKIEKINKEGRSYIVKEAEFVVNGYINKLDKSLEEKKVKNIERKYKRTKILNFILGTTIVVSLIFAICF